VTQPTARGATIWFTGLSGSGKSSIANLVAYRLVHAGVATCRLDGDSLRRGLNADLSFTRDDRMENVRRVAHVACLLAGAGIVAVVSLISPYAEGRLRARQIHEEAGRDFLEVFVATPLEECERRDPKGLYALARSGDLSGLTGVDDPYEPPEHPELTLTDPSLCLEDSADLALRLLVGRGVVCAEVLPPELDPSRGKAEQVAASTTSPESLTEAMPFAARVGVEMTSISPAEVRARLGWDTDRCTGGGMLHGGAIMTLADTTGASCAFLNLPGGALGTATVESKTNFLRAVREGWVESRSRPLHVGRTLIVVETDVVDQQGRLVARVTQTQAVLR
jgi:adenylyl-sulfate kinase